MVGVPFAFPVRAMTLKKLLQGSKTCLKYGFLYSDRLPGSNQHPQREWKLRKLCEYN